MKLFGMNYIWEPSSLSSSSVSSYHPFYFLINYSFPSIALQFLLLLTCFFWFILCGIDAGFEVRQGNIAFCCDTLDFSKMTKLRATFAVSLTFSFLTGQWPAHKSNKIFHYYMYLSIHWLKNLCKKDRSTGYK